MENINLKHIPKTLKNIDNFLLWRKEQLPDGRISKKPSNYAGGNLTGFLDNPDALHNFKDIEKALDAAGGGVDGIGFSLLKDGVTNDTGKRLFFYDIDGTVNDPIIDVLKDKTYIEYSPSGNGLHAYFFVDSNDFIGKKLGSYELYSHGRYFTVTGNRHDFSTDDIQEIDQETYEILLRTVTKDENDPRSKLLENYSSKELNVFNGTCELSSEEVLEKARNHKTRGEDFTAIIEGRFNEARNKEGKHFVDKETGAIDISRADLSILGSLVYIVKGDRSKLFEVYRSCVGGWYRPTKDHQTGRIGSTINKVVAEFIERKKEEEKYNIQIKEEYSDIPTPYIIKDKELKKEVTKGSGDKEITTYVRVSRDIPRVKSILRDIESDKEYYQVQFDNLKRKRKFTIERAGSVFQDPRKLRELADYGLSVEDPGDLIQYFATYLSYNVPKTINGVTRLGHIENHFVYPNASNDYKLIVEDDGYKDMLKSFEQKGTLEDYQKNVFSLLKGNKVATFYVFAALSSVLFKPFNAEPIIVDINDRTSTGKTALLRLASSIYGDYKKMVISWDTTIVNIERRSAFLNSFPLFVDDTQKFNGDKKNLNEFIYNYSNGQSRGRGNVHSIEKLLTWSNVLLSTGEDSMDNFTDNKGGAGARVITIKEKPFESVNFEKLYENINEYYGVLGIRFYEQFASDEEKYRKTFKTIVKKYISKSDEKEVLIRISRSIAMIELAGVILSDIKGFETDYESVCEYVFENMKENSQSIDTFKNQLLEILEKLDVNRNQLLTDESDIEYMARGEIYGAIKKQYLAITPKFLRDELGVSFNSTIKEWKERGYLYHDKDKLQKTVHTVNGYRKWYALSNQILEELGFDFNSEVSHANGLPVIPKKNQNR